MDRGKARYHQKSSRGRHQHEHQSRPASQEQPPRHKASRNDNRPIRQSSIRIRLRDDQLLEDRDNDAYQDNNVHVVAPKWVGEGLHVLDRHIRSDTICRVFDKRRRHLDLPLERLSLISLQRIARNDAFNTNGVIRFESYGSQIRREVVVSLKDLVRQTVIVGSDMTTHFGGYPKDTPRVPQQKKVYVCDLIGLQFQELYNSGRLVVIGKDIEKGLLDDFIFEHIVGEPKKSYSEVTADRSGRYARKGDYYFDRKAYIQFVANDVLISGLAIERCAEEDVNFKFLKYGTGYFAGVFKPLLEADIYKGVTEGLARLLPQSKHIKSVELPFYKPYEKIKEVCAKNGVAITFSEADALKQTDSRLPTATTNCADPHASTGNRMGFGSIDGAIAENLSKNAMNFCPNINKMMRQLFL